MLIEGPRTMDRSADEHLFGSGGLFVVAEAVDVDVVLLNGLLCNYKKKFFFFNEDAHTVFMKQLCIPVRSFDG